jgi:hypothetical protein
MGKLIPSTSLVCTILTVVVGKVVEEVLTIGQDVDVECPWLCTLGSADELFIYDVSQLASSDDVNEGLSESSRPRLRVHSISVRDITGAPGQLSVCSYSSKWDVHTLTDHKRLGRECRPLRGVV